MNSKQCFVISPIGKAGSKIREYADHLLSTVLRPAAEPLGYTVTRADDLQEPGQITQQVIDNIVRADLVIAVLNDGNANVFYELGVCHTLQRNVLLVLEQGGDRPFDIRHLRVLEISTRTPTARKKAIDQIEGQIRTIEKAQHGSSVPVRIPIDALKTSILAASIQKAGERWALVAGAWTGYTKQDIVRNGENVSQQYNMDAELTAKDGAVSGRVTILYGDTLDFDPSINSATLELTGRFLVDDTLSMEFENTQFPQHFGHFIVKMNESADELQGRFVANGVETCTVVQGDIFLRRRAGAVDVSARRPD